MSWFLTKIALVKSFLFLDGNSLTKFTKRMFLFLAKHALLKMFFLLFFGRNCLAENCLVIFLVEIALLKVFFLMFFLLFTCWNCFVNITKKMFLVVGKYWLAKNFLYFFSWRKLLSRKLKRKSVLYLWNKFLAKVGICFTFSTKTFLPKVLQKKYFLFLAETAFAKMFLIYFQMENVVLKQIYKTMCPLFVTKIVLLIHFIFLKNCLSKN